MNKSQLIAILALVVQIGNAGSVFLGMLPADVALYVAASLGAVQAFTFACVLGVVGACGVELGCHGDHDGGSGGAAGCQ